MADALLLRPLPVVRPDQVVTVGSRVLRGTIYQNFASYPDYIDIRDRVHTLSGIAAYDHLPVSLETHAGDGRRIRFATFVSPNFFDVFQVGLQRGRTFLPDEDGQGGRGAVVVISDALWRADFAADPAVLGRKLRLANHEFTIVGIAPASFSGLHPFIRDSVFVPMRFMPRLVDLKHPNALDARDVRFLTLKGRLRAGVTLAEAQAELTTLWADLQRAYPDTNGALKLTAQSELAYRVEQRPLDSTLLITLSVLSMAVLCVACANVAGLLASRAPVRAREIALRLAVGANRARLVRQLVTESLVVAAAGAVGGLAIGQLGIQLLGQIRFPSDMISRPEFSLDARALGFSLLIAAACALVVGLGPAIQTTRVDLNATLKSSDRAAAAGPRRVSGRSILVGLQVALSLVVVTIATFTNQVFFRELNAGPGFRIHGMAKVSMDPSQAGYTREEAARFFTTALERTRQLPLVRSAAIASAMPLFGFQFVSVVPDGRLLAKGETGTPVWATSVDAEYFRTMEIAVLGGRAIETGDDAAAPAIAVINETMASQYWPAGDAIGKRVRVLDPPFTVVEIVGITRTVTHGFPGESPQPAIYFSYLQRPRSQMVLLARTDDSAALLQPLGDIVRTIDPDVPVFDVQTIEAFYDARVASIGRVLARLVTAMGIMGLALTMIGLYGLVSYSVHRRTREIGIRIAVGATSVRIVRMVLGEGMIPAAVGVAAGLALSVATARLLTMLIPFGHHLNMHTLLVVTPLMVAVTLIAAYLPARRAATVDPTVALRCE
jgi:putative ABC transport system permease protein